MAVTPSLGVGRDISPPTQSRCSSQMFWEAGGTLSSFHPRLQLPFTFSYLPLAATASPEGRAGQPTARGTRNPAHNLLSHPQAGPGEGIQLPQILLLTCLWLTGRAELILHPDKGGLTMFLFPVESHRFARADPQTRRPAAGERSALSPHSRCLSEFDPHPVSFGCTF